MSGSVAVFAYGTLMLDEVMRAVTGRSFPGEPARLRGHRRRRIVDRSYPGVVPHPGEDTTGMVFRDIDAAAIERLDAFEGDLYDRLALPVRTDGDEQLSAWTYVVKERHRHRLSDEVWVLEDFLLEHGEAFMESCRRFRDEGVM